MLHDMLDIRAGGKPVDRRADLGDDPEGFRLDQRPTRTLAECLDTSIFSAFGRAVLVIEKARHLDTPLG